MAKIWFRVGMEAEITEEEMNTLLVYIGEADGERDVRKSHAIMEDIIKKAELSGETYIPEKNNGCEDYDNPKKEIDFQF